MRGVRKTGSMERVWVHRRVHGGTCLLWQVGHVHIAAHKACVGHVMRGTHQVGSAPAGGSRFPGAAPPRPGSWAPARCGAAHTPLVRSSGTSHAHHPHPHRPPRCRHHTWRAPPSTPAPSRLTLPFCARSSGPCTTKCSHACGRARLRCGCAWRLRRHTRARHGRWPGTRWLGCGGRPGAARSVTPCCAPSVMWPHTHA